MIRMRTAVPQTDECSLHGFGLRTALLKLGIELNHEFLGAVVVNVPQAQDERLRSRLQQAADQAHQLITGRDHIQAGSASAQHDQLDRQLQVGHVVEAEMRRSQTNRRKHRVVLPKISVRRNVYGLAPRPVGLQYVFGCIVAQE